MVLQATNMEVVQQRVRAIQAIEWSSSVADIQTSGSLPVLSNGKNILTQLASAGKAVVSEGHDFAGSVQAVANKKFEDDAQDARIVKGAY